MNYYDDFQLTSCAVGLLKLPDAQLHLAIIFCCFLFSLLTLVSRFATTMKPLNALPKFENHFVVKTVRFQVQLEADGYFFFRKFLSLQPQQAGRVGTNSQFLNQIFQIRLQKHLLGFAQTRYSAQNCADCVS